jgi:surface protein
MLISNLERLVINIDKMKPFRASWRVKKGSVTLPLKFHRTDVEFAIDWGDGIISSNELDHTYEENGEYTICFYGKIQAMHILDYPSIQVVKVFDLGDCDWITFAGSFENCKSLTKFNSGSCNTSNVTSMKNMFHGCKNLTDIDLSTFDSSSVINMEGLFHKTINLNNLNIDNLNTSFVENMKVMFRKSGINHLDLRNLDVFNVTTMSRMFSGMNNLLSLDLERFDAGSVLSFRGMFKNCYNLQNLNLDHMRTDSALDMQGMFEKCRGLVSLDLSSFNTECVTDMRAMFKCCDNLKEVNLGSFKTSNVVDFGAIFFYSDNLKEIDLSNFRFSAVANFHNFVHYKSKANVKIKTRYKKNIDYFKEGSQFTTDQNQEDTKNTWLESIS